MKTNKTDMTKQARKERYQEHLELSMLPFLSEDQAKRASWLERQRLKDNRYAFQYRMTELEDGDNGDINGNHN